jgi:hypothetical protein
MNPFNKVAFDADPQQHQAILDAAVGPGAGVQGEVYRNDKYQVVVRDAGKFTMLSIRRNDRETIHDWRELQTIKNMLAGPEREAVELYPAESRRVDTSNQYYLWVLPEGDRVGFGFGERLISEKSVMNSKQRPFDDPADKAEAARTDRTIEARLMEHLRACGVSTETVDRKKMKEQQNEVRPDLEPLPDRLKHLPIDDRGFPIPWFVAWIDGKPEFRAMDGDKWRKAVRDRLCWVCGGPMGVNVAFVAGPMCGINRISSEPPSHLECARWSARNCPFLANPNQVRREDEWSRDMEDRETISGCHLKRNPGVAMVWVTRTFDVMRVPLSSPGNPGKLVVMGEPSNVEWWAEGKPATREQVIESIESGYPALAATAQRPGELEELHRARERFWKYIPG